MAWRGQCAPCSGFTRWSGSRGAGSRSKRSGPATTRCWGIRRRPPTQINWWDSPSGFPVTRDSRCRPWLIAPIWGREGGQRRGRAGAATVMAATAVAILLVLALSPLRLVDAQQTPGADDVHFDVAAIKLTPPDVRGNTINIGPEAVQISNWPVRWYIKFAYSIHGSQLTGGPEWARVDRFDVTAKFPKLPAVEKGSPVWIDRTRSALRTLLAERFQLRLRQELWQVPVYSLVVDEGGHKLTPARIAS